MRLLGFPSCLSSITVSGIVREQADRYDLKSPTLFIFAEKDEVIPLDQVSPAASLKCSVIVLIMHFPFPYLCINAGGGSGDEAEGEVHCRLPGEDLPQSDPRVRAPEERRHRRVRPELHPGGPAGHDELVK